MAGYARSVFNRRREMAIGLRLKITGGTQEQYDALHAHMGIDGDPPEGLIFHAAGPIEEGWGIIDFWESREHFDRFRESRLMPAFGELGDQAPQSPPDIKEFPVHNLTKP
jgi:hypothetical protein